MLKRIKIKEFKSLSDAVIDLGQVNVFVGANGSGKSNILEAIGVAGAAMSGQIDDESLLYRGVRPGVPALYKSSFSGIRPATTINFEMTTEIASYFLKIFNPLSSPERAWSFHSENFKCSDPYFQKGRSPRTADRYNMKRSIAPVIMAEIDNQHPLAALLNDLYSYSIYTPTTHTLRGIAEEKQMRSPVGLSGGGLARAMQDLKKDKGFYLGHYNEIVNLVGWAEDFGTASPSQIPLSPSVASGDRVLYFRDRYMSQSRKTLSGYDASEGALYILFLAVLAFHKESPRVFSIDNADSAINPVLAKKTMSYFCRWILDGETEKQALLTAHNPYVLDGLPLQDDRVRLFVVDRSSRGQTEVRRIEVDERMLGLANNGWTLSRLWATGRLGGVPNV